MSEYIHKSYNVTVLIEEEFMFKQFLFYAAIGAIGTVAHFAVLYSFVEFMDFDPVVGSSLGFLTGAIVNYLLNYKYTFNSKAEHLETFMRFFLIAVAGLLINTGIMSFLIYFFSLHYLLSQVVATGVIVVITFLMNKSWTFKINHYVE